MADVDDEMVYACERDLRVRDEGVMGIELKPVGLEQACNVRELLAGAERVLAALHRHVHAPLHPRPDPVLALLVFGAHAARIHCQEAQRKLQPRVHPRRSVRDDAVIHVRGHGGLGRVLRAADDEREEGGNARLDQTRHERALGAAGSADVGVDVRDARPQPVASVGVDLGDLEEVDRVRGVVEGLHDRLEALPHVQAAHTHMHLRVRYYIRATRTASEAVART
eukprot:2945463-Rhodomonas_salina.3